jgi:hypothetical protein
VSQAKPGTQSNPHKLHALEDQEIADDLEVDVWRESNLEEDEVDVAEVDVENEELNALYNPTPTPVDRSKQACHNFFFSPSGCAYLAKGKPCPYSHDPAIGLKVIEAASANMKKLMAK